jgi:flagellum-specific ATP synthase
VSAALLDRAALALRDADLARTHGRVSNLIGLIIEATGLQAEVGEVCLVASADRGPAGAEPLAAVPAEVVGFREGRTLLMPLVPARRCSAPAHRFACPSARACSGA